MPDDSEFHPGNSGITRGGLDRYLGPEARDYSNIPAALGDEKSNPDESPRQMDCAGKDAGESVCEIANAEEEQRERGSNAT